MTNLGCYIPSKRNILNLSLPHVNSKLSPSFCSIFEDIIPRIAVWLWLVFLKKPMNYITNYITNISGIQEISLAPFWRLINGSLLQSRRTQLNNVVPKISRSSNIVKLSYFFYRMYPKRQLTYKNIKMKKLWLQLMIAYYSIYLRNIYIRKKTSCKIKL